MVIPETRRRRRRDRDAALLLLWHPVHRRGALVDLADLVDLLGVEEDPLGHGRLPRIDVGDDPDVPHALERVLALDLALPGLCLDCHYQRSATTCNGRTLCWPRPSCASLPCVER